MRTLARQYGECACGDMEPRPLLRGVMPCKALGQSPCLGGRTPLRPTVGALRMQVVYHQHDLVGGRIAGVGQVPPQVGPVSGAPPLPHLAPPAPSSRVHPHEEIGRPLAGRLRLLFASRAAGRGQRLAPRGRQLRGLLVHADHGTVRGLGPGIPIPHLFPLGHNPCPRFGDAPGFEMPRRHRVFLSAVPTALCARLSPGSNPTRSPARTRHVHRACPAGGSEQASTTSGASTSPLILGSRPGPGFSPSAAPNPCCPSRPPVAETLLTLVPHAATIAPCVRGFGPFTSAIQSLCARLRGLDCSRRGPCVPKLCAPRLSASLLVACSSSLFYSTRQLFRILLY